MSAPAPRLRTIKQPALPAADTREQKFWRSFKLPVIAKDYAPITHVSCCAQDPWDFCISSGARVQVFSGKTRKMIKNISRFQQKAYSPQIRRDGKLLLAADESGLLQVFDMASRNILKSLKGHSLPAHCAQWHPEDLTQFVSASDDRSVKLWDLSASEPVRAWQAHTDYVRATTFSGDGGVIVSGGYDGLVKVWDPRSPDCVLQFDQGSPVECTLSLRNKTIVSGGRHMHVWDLVGGKRRHVIGAHQKTVTSLCTNGAATRILSGGLDGLVKIYDDAWKVIHGVKYGGPVLALSVSPDDRHFLAGTANGILSIRTRPSPKAQQAARVKSAAQKRRLAGRQDDGRGEDYIVEKDRRKRLKPLERLLLAYRFTEALEAVLSPSTPATTTFTLLVELRHRGALRVALNACDESTLDLLFLFITRHLSRPQFILVLTHVAMILIDIYGGTYGRSKLMTLLRHNVRRQVEHAKDATRMQGMLQMYM